MISLGGSFTNNPRHKIELIGNPQKFPTFWHLIQLRPAQIQPQWTSPMAGLGVHLQPGSSLHPRAVSDGQPHCHRSGSVQNVLEDARGFEADAG